jgi:GNAT superfamily N-acetyltransferase
MKANLKQEGTDLEEIRLVKQAEMKEAIAASDRIFKRDSDMLSMGEAFPILFSETYSHSFGLFADGKLLSFMGLVPAQIRIGRSRVNVFSIGSVFTLEEARNRGLAGRVLEHIKGYSKQAGAPLLLVSGDGPLYSRAGCRPFGELVQYVWTPELAGRWNASGRAKTYQVSEARHQDVLHLHRLAAQRYAAYEQSIWDISLLLKTEADVSNRKMKQRVYAVRSNEKIVAFAVVALPASASRSNPYVVEWAGEAEALVALLSHVVNEFGLDRLDIFAAPHEQAMHAALKAAESQNIRNQGTVLLVDPKQLFEQLKPYIEEKLPVVGKLLRVINTDDGAQWGYPGLPDVTFRYEQLISLLFDRYHGLELPAAWAEITTELFPLPFPYTGGLNFV